MNRSNDFYNESSEYSNYDGAEVESGFFAQGAMGDQQSVIEPLDRTLTFVITNGTIGVGNDNAILFAGNIQPLIQPPGVTVTVVETGGGPTSHEEVRMETIGNPFAIQGLRYFVSNATQFSNALQIQKRFPTGKLIQYLWQPSNYLSPTNFNALLLDSPDFGIVVDGRTSITVPIQQRAAIENPNTQVTLVFTLKAKTNTANVLFNKNQKEFGNAPRPVGNPLGDVALMARRAE